MLCPHCKQNLDEDSRFCGFCGKPVSSSLSDSKCSYSIGRAPENDLVLDNVRVSRSHARLYRQGTQWILEDLGSRNGTLVNGKAISRTAINPEDLIVIAGLPLRLGEIIRPQAQQRWNDNLRFTAHNLCFKVQDKTIIDDISLCFQPGQFVGLVGPSGSGKTTLMMMLNGYLTPTSGLTMLNRLSVHHNPTAFQGQIGYVPQDDIIHRELTVGESLTYTSKLRLGESLSPDEREAQIQKILQSVNMTSSRDVLIGSPEKKGISGGQRKRVNMAQELITEPLLYFLDEPTSGLDPSTDHEVMILLKSTADRGHIVILTTHKIDQRNISLFSHLLVLGLGGKLAYYGPASEATAYFHVSEPDDIIKYLKGCPEEEPKQRYRESKYYREMVLEGINHVPENTVLGKRRFTVPAFYQYMVLLSRNLLVKWRDYFSSLILLLQAPIIGLFMLLVFGSGKAKVPNKPGLLFMMLVASIWLGTSNSAREIVGEQTIFRREHKAALSLPAYLFSKITILGMLCALQCLILTAFGYASMELEIAWGGLYLVLWLTSLVAMLMGLLISSIVKTGEAAMALVPITLIPQVVMGGLIVKFDYFSDLVKILSGTMLSRWAFELLLILEDSGGMLIKDLGFSADNKAADLVVISLMMILFGTVAYLAVKNKKH